MRRLLGTMACLALLGTLASPGLCFMPRAPSQNSPAGSEHDCCRAGLRSTPPVCCMSSMAAEPPGRMRAKDVVEPAAASQAPFVPVPACAGPLVTPSACLGTPHLKAPPLILRV